MTTIVLPSKFDFSYHKNFTDQYASALADGSESAIVLDFSSVEYIDSAALGMMVLLKKKAEAENRTVVIENASGAALDVLNIANFKNLFEIK
ncbi:anti-sigma factor antagonist [Alteromonas sediminis]|uniref:Anti-sigma factor antagonist n=1 Tax=Alteromonas sediminis TaxID=2259342 RepID=A0A3N5Y3H7_9ALTE|nr:STAS domain-containing protein [Alteromonas sediminis]RPJ68597.1 anti-sigma factor antagonist [Alteromonas sediminis]